MRKTKDIHHTFLFEKGNSTHLLQWQCTGTLCNYQNIQILKRLKPE